MRGSTFLLGPSIFDLRKARQILIFSLSLSLSLYPFFLSLLPCLFFFSSPFSLPFLPYPTKFPLSLCLFLSHFSISFSFPLFFFSFLFSYYLILIHPSNLSKSGGNCPILLHSNTRDLLFLLFYTTVSLDFGRCPISELITHSPKIVNNQQYAHTPDFTRCYRAYEMHLCHFMLCYATCTIFINSG